MKHHLKCLNKYTVTPYYQNLMHDLTIKNYVDWMEELLSSCSTRYIIPVSSLLTMGKGKILIQLLNFLTQDENNEKRYLIKNLSTLGICNMLSLPPDFSVKYLQYFMDANKRVINELIG
jgi:hypothetical protein